MTYTKIAKTPRLVPRICPNCDDMWHWQRINQDKVKIFVKRTVNCNPVRYGRPREICPDCELKALARGNTKAAFNKIREG